VLDDVSLEISPGEAVALIGENGAGKSTLAKIVAGVETPSSGSLSLAGASLDFASPRDAIAAGVGFIPQELTYVPELTAAENITMGEGPSRFGFTSAREMQSRAKSALSEIGFQLDPRRQMDQLSVAEQQIVEIVKALTRKVRILVLDEPTAALGEAESELLFTALKRLRTEGVAILLVLHRLDQVDLIADRIYVLRNGIHVMTAERGEFDREKTVTAMLGEKGRAAEIRVSKQSAAGAGEEKLLSLSELTTLGDPGLKRLDLEVRAGEILGVFGVKGAGGELLGPMLGGLARPAAGEIEVSGKSFKGFATPSRAQNAGVAYLPRERKREGLVLERSIVENICLTVPAGYSRLGFIRRRGGAAIAARMIEQLDIRCVSIYQPVGDLSGGNQQKVLLASRLLAEPRVLVLDHPTRGVDVGARTHIHSYLRELAEQGVGLLLISTDVEEAAVLADRLLVLRRGAVVGELTGSDLTQERALRIASGG
jgi:ribose transport system ATP-binding protein